jgi:CMP-N-acetylneuraminic acid synthetase
MSMNKLTAIIPMRHSSERVPGKNYRDFAGKPLFHYIVQTLLDCKQIDQVVVDTDSLIVQEQCNIHFPSVLVLERPEHLKDGSIPMNDVLLNTINQVPSEFYLQTHSTNPILTAATLSAGIDTFFKVYPMYDSLFSVTRKHVRFWDSLARPVNHNANILLRTQDLPPIFEENSCFYLFTKEILENKHNRIGNRPFLYEIPEAEAQDIDVELNFIMAELLYKNLNKIQI